jgi:hypothetical protein
MGKKRLYVLAEKKTSDDGQVVPGKVLGNFWAPEHAAHDAARLADGAKLNAVNVGLFLDNRPVEGFQLI